MPQELQNPPLRQYTALGMSSWNEQYIASLIATLLTDFICRISEVPQDSACRIKRCHRNRDNEADLSEALRCILTHLANAYIMIDGLDEWRFDNGSRSNLLDWITGLDKWNIPHLHVLLTSQNLPDIEKRLSDNVLYVSTLVQIYLFTLNMNFTGIH